MDRGRGSGPSEHGRRRFKSFAEFARETQETGEDLETWVYPSLKFGAVFWIPDEVTGFGTGKEHPCVIVVPHRRGYPMVTVCPRTSQVERNMQNGLFTPAGIVDSLDRDGVILLAEKHRRPLRARDFRDRHTYRHVGDLPPEWQDQLRAEITSQAPDIGQQSEEP